jgi:hypothetical protein
MSCACGKSTYPSRGVAQQALDSIRRNGEKRDRTPQRVYPCPSGRGWHMTSQQGADDDTFSHDKSKAARRGRTR